MAPNSVEASQGHAALASSLGEQGWDVVNII